MIGSYADGFDVNGADSIYRFTLLEAERFFFLVNDKSGLNVHLASSPDYFSAARDVLVGCYS